MRRKNLALIAAWTVVIAAAITIVIAAVASALNGEPFGLVFIGIVAVVVSAFYLVEHYDDL